MTPAQKTEVLDLLAAVRKLILRPGNEFALTDWSGPEQAVEEIDRLRSMVEADHAQTLAAITLLFAPTANLQDVSFDSGWSREYLDLAGRLDRINTGVGDG